MLAMADHPARSWEPKRLRLRLARNWRWADPIASAITRLQMLPAP